MRLKMRPRSIAEYIFRRHNVSHFRIYLNCLRIRAGRIFLWRGIPIIYLLKRLAAFLQPFRWHMPKQKHAPCPIHRGLGDWQVSIAGDLHMRVEIHPSAIRRSEGANRQVFGVPKPRVGVM